MGLDLKSVVPWGRSLDEYRRMFALMEADLRLRILDCGGGPAGFAAELAGSGGRPVAADPLYALPAEDIRRQIAETYEVILEGVRRDPDRFVWDAAVPTPEALGSLRLAAMDRFLEDLPSGLAAGRYQVRSLPSLGLPDGSFDLALCSHLLFLYSDLMDLEFHLASVRELCRVAGEVRIFPLLDLTGQPSAHLKPVLAMLEAEGVAYEFQRNGNEMLRIWPL